MKGRMGVLLTGEVIVLSLVLGYLLYISFQPVSDLARLGEEEPYRDAG